MYVGRAVFAQVMDSLPPRRFHMCVRRYDGNHKVKTFSCLDRFRVMAFAQLTYRESLRDIEACLRAMRPKLYHMGIRSTVSRNTLDIFEPYDGAFFDLLRYELLELEDRLKRKMWSKDDATHGFDRAYINALDHGRHTARVSLPCFILGEPCQRRR